MRILLQTAFLGLALMALAGCESRSISDSGYQEPNWGGGANPGSNPMYQGELSAYDVLGADSQTGFSDADIQRALASKQPIVIKPGSPVMLVQSGALFADPEMIAALGKHYQISSFTGVPRAEDRIGGKEQPPAPPYSQVFRMAAAKGGFGIIIVYWGVLESAPEGLPTKGISWVPIIGGVIPDQMQRMRIRLIAAIIDVRSGQWETYVPEPFEDNSISNQQNRAASDQGQVEELKTEGYQALAEGIATRYGG
ncbi:MAG TPA: hypothetical protein VGM59_12215 [Dongiaceae bacterium]|jgi:hypothetical protein